MTPFGIKVMSDARLLLDQAKSIAALASPDADIAGEVGLCCYEAIAPFILPKLLRHLEERLPAVNVKFLEGNLESTSKSLKNGRADLAITYDLGIEANMHKQVLYTLQPQIICAKDHEFSQSKSLSLSSLDQQTLILLDQPLSAQYVLGLLRASGAEPKAVRSVKSFELQRSLVANNFGVALAHTLPETKMSYDGNPIVSIPISDKIIEQRVQMICSEQSMRRPVINAVLNEVGNLFSS